MNANPRNRRRAQPTPTTPVVWTLLALLISGFLLASAGYASPTSPPSEAIVGTASQATDEQTLEAYGKLPLTFVPNQGQVADEQVRYHAQGAGFGFSFTPTGAMLSFVGEKAPNSGEAAGATEGEEPAVAARGVALALDFLEANPDAELEARKKLAGKVNYMRGSDPAEHQTDLPTYGELVYEDLWSGVDLAVRGEEGALKYEFLVEPGARVEDIGLAYRGADGLSLDEEGNVQISTALGELTDTAPVSYQEIDGERVLVESHYVLDDGAGSYGFELGAGYDPSRPLVIDPGITYSTFLGGPKYDEGVSIAVDESGNAYVTGLTRWPTYPTTPGAFDIMYGGNADAFVTKLDANGSVLLYSTFLGGTQFDKGHGIAVDREGNAYVTGVTYSDDYSTTPKASDTTLDGGRDAFVTKLDAAGSALLYSTLLGGTDSDAGWGIAVDQNDRAYVTGHTHSADYPTTLGAFDTTFPGGTFDVFVTKLNANGSNLAYSTFLGGPSTDEGFGIAVDQNGRAYVTGYTGPAAGYPTTAGAFDTTFNGGTDVFVTKLNATGSALAYSTYLGGKNYGRGFGIAVDQDGNAYVTGETASADYPTTLGAFDTTLDGSRDAFVTKLNAAGSALPYSTFLGGKGLGKGSDQGWSIAVDQNGRAYVTGYTRSEDYPTTPGADTTYNQNRDAFVTKLNAAGSNLPYSTYLGGNVEDEGRGIAVDQGGNAYVTGLTASAGYVVDFPTTPGAFDMGYNGGKADAFVTKLPTN